MGEMFSGFWCGWASSLDNFQIEHCRKTAFFHLYANVNFLIFFDLLVAGTICFLDLVFLVTRVRDVVGVGSMDGRDGIEDSDGILS